MRKKVTFRKLPNVCKRLLVYFLFCFVFCTMQIIIASTPVVSYEDEMR